MTIRLARPDLGAEELAALEEVLSSGQLTMGEKVVEFEREIARACEVPHAVAVSSGTAALHLALRALDIGPGDEVIVPAYTFPATANVAELVGARAVLVDVEDETMNASLEAVGAAITPRTKAVMGVHLFGRALDWDGLEAIVPTGMSLIEDAAGALGARFKGRACGSLGIMGCLSFHPRKTVTTGEGGAVTTDNGDLADAVRRGRHHGIEPRGPFEILQASTNYRLSDLACAIGIPQMRRLDTLLAARARIAHGYSERLAALSDRVLCPSASAGDEHGWQAYVVQLDRRDEVMAALRAEEIECQIGTYALHRLGAYSDQGPFPAADRVFERALALPLHSQLTGSDLDRVSEVLARALDA